MPAHKSASRTPGWAEGSSPLTQEGLLSRQGVGKGWLHSGHQQRQERGVDQEHRKGAALRGAPTKRRCVHCLLTKPETFYGPQADPRGLK